MPSLLFCSSSPKHVFSPAENFLLICCCFSKTRQFSVINQTKFEQIIVKCKMRSQHAFLFLSLSFFFFFLKLDPCYIISLEINALWCPVPSEMDGSVWFSELAIWDRIERIQGLLYVLPVITPSWCVCCSMWKWTSCQEMKFCVCFPCTLIHEKV